MPLLFFAILIFIFQSGLEDIQVNQLRQNCPYPIMNQNITNTNIDNVFVTYNTTDYAYANTASKVTTFQCGQNGVMGVTTAVFTYTSGFFDAQQAWLGYASSSMSAFFDKVQATLTLAWLYFNAPAEVTGLAFFTYIQAFLLSLTGLGFFMVIRGGNG